MKGHFENFHGRKIQTTMLISTIKSYPGQVGASYSMTSLDPQDPGCWENIHTLSGTLGQRVGRSHYD